MQKSIYGDPTSASLTTTTRNGISSTTSSTIPTSRFNATIDCDANQYILILANIMEQLEDSRNKGRADARLAILIEQIKLELSQTT